MPQRVDSVPQHVGLSLVYLLQSVKPIKEFDPFSGWWLERA